MRARRRRGIRTGRPSRWHAPIILLLGIAATLCSSMVEQRTLVRYPGIEGCASGCEVAAAGWPLPYLVDDPSLSPANAASLAGAVSGVDRWRAEALALDLLGWTTLAGVLALLLRRLRR